jgi:hypothetical protein
MMPENTRIGVVLAVVALSSAGGTARAQSFEISPDVQVEDVLGGQCSLTWGTIRVTVANHTSDRTRGDLVIMLRSMERVDFVLPMTLEPRATGQAMVVVPPNWCGVQACFRSEGRRDRCSSTGATWPDGRGHHNGEVLLIQRELELRPALSVARVTNELRDSRYESYSEYNGGTSPTRSPLVTVLEVGTDGAPLLLPNEPVAYQHYRMVLTEAAVLARLDDGQRRALGLWVRTGGELTVVGRSAREIGDAALVRELVPGFSAGDGEVPAVMSPGLRAVHFFGDLEAETDSVLDRGTFAHAAPRLEATSYGTRLDVGLGTVHFVMVAPAVSESLEGASVSAGGAVEELLAWSGRFRSAGWQGVNVENGMLGVLPEYYTTPDNLLPEREAASRLRLDPNLNDRLPIWVYLLVVFGCITVMFLLHRRWVRRRGQVWRLAGSSAAVALAGCLLVFVLAWAVRGSGSWYRSMAWIEAGSGSRAGVMWRRLALATDAPGSRTVPFQPGLPLLARDVTLDLARRTARVDASRWETVIAAEHGVVELDGTVELSSPEAGRVEVRNTFDRPLRGAVLVSGGEHHRVGTIEAGEEVVVDTTRNVAPAALPVFVPGEIDRRTIAPPGAVALVAEVDAGCPARGDFAAQRCDTTLVVWRRP